MINKLSSLKNYTCEYNFNTDTGAQGVYVSDFILPTSCSVLIFCVTTSAGLQSGGLTTIDIGTTNVPNALLSAEAFTSFVTGGIVIDKGGAFRIATGGERITFTIAVADLIGGALTISIAYLEF